MNRLQIFDKFITSAENKGVEENSSVWISPYGTAACLLGMLYAGKVGFDNALAEFQNFIKDRTKSGQQKRDFFIEKLPEFDEDWLRQMENLHTGEIYTIADVRDNLAAIEAKIS